MQHIYKIHGDRFEETVQYIKDLLNELGYTEDNRIEKKEETGETEIFSGCYSRWYLFKKETDYLYPVLFRSPQETVIVISGTDISRFMERFTPYMTRMDTKHRIKMHFQKDE